MTHDELIGRLTQATGPDRELDARIRYALSPFMQALGTADEWLETDVSKSSGTKPYTGSIDAALTLVPEGMDWRVERFTNEAYPHRNGGMVFAPGAASSLKTSPTCWGGATPAIALCIAALKARSRSSGREGLK